jgi:hypothetical protein
LKLPVIGILSGVALATLGLSGIAEAAIVVPPTGLAPGSEYRLVFVTSGARNATSSNITDYNIFVQNAARSSSVLNTALTTAGFDPTSISWTAIASTSAVNARVNTQTQATDTSRPIYRLDGALIATSYTDLWDGSIEARINLTELDGNGFGLVWTGTDLDGETCCVDRRFVADSGREYGLGSQLGLGSLGFPNGGFWPGSWVLDLFEGGSSALITTDELTSDYSFYGISSLLVVPASAGAPTTTTPEPSSLLGFITLGGLMLGGAARKVRK